MAFSRTHAEQISPALSAYRDDSDGYDTRWDITAVWNDGHDYWCFLAVADETMFRAALAALKPLLAGTGVTLFSRIVPSWDDGDGITVLEAVVL